jgi:hypothetical protein
MMDDDDDDSHVLLRQLQRARTKWGRIVLVLRSEGVKPRSIGYFYKAVVQSILLYGSETWVVSKFYDLKQFHSGPVSNW